MASLMDLCTPRPVGDHYVFDVPAGWRQGRGVFGGLVVGALIEAIEQQVADPARKVRSVTAELPGPVEAGTVEIEVEPLRQGKNVSTMRAALSQHGEIRSHAVAILGASRAGGSALNWNDLTPPEVTPWAAIPPVPAAGVEFAHHFEYRVVEGIPLSGKTSRAIGWVRARDPGPRRGAAYIAAMVDAWWPTAFNRFTAMRPMATIAFTLDILGDLDGLDPAAPLLHRAVAPVCADGYFVETRELWGEDGRLIAINHQTFAIIQ
jgi:acyl-CoA thioesterase